MSMTSTQRRAWFTTAAAMGLLVIGTPGRAEAATLQVPSQYSTIQAAADKAIPGDTVLVGVCSDRGA